MGMKDEEHAGLRERGGVSLALTARSSAVIESQEPEGKNAVA
jgi:hypothetical protein